MAQSKHFKPKPKPVEAETTNWAAVGEVKAM